MRGGAGESAGGERRGCSRRRFHRGTRRWFCGARGVVRGHARRSGLGEGSTRRGLGPAHEGAPLPSSRTMTGGHSRRFRWYPTRRREFDDERQAKSGSRGSHSPQSCGPSLAIHFRPRAARIAVTKNNSVRLNCVEPRSLVRGPAAMLAHSCQPSALARPCGPERPPVIRLASLPPLGDLP